MIEEGNSTIEFVARRGLRQTFLHLLDTCMEFAEIDVLNGRTPGPPER